MALDIAVLAVAFGAALLLRFDGEVPRRSVTFTAQVFPFIALAFAVTHALFGVYRTVWAYGSVGDVLGLFGSCAGITALVFGVSIFLPERHLPLSVILMAGALAFPGMALVKMRTRIFARVPWADVASRRLLIIGAGRNGQLLARELQNVPRLNYQPVGFVDNDPRKLHSRIHGLRVLGTDDELPRLIEERAVEAVAIAIPNAPGSTIRRIVAICQQSNIPVRMVPTIDNWAGGTGPQDTFRDVTLDDLLGREPVEIDAEACSQTVRDRVVLVTGAAGSIGSELCRQVLRFAPRELHLLDNNETGLHDLALELSRAAADTSIHQWVTNVGDQGKVDFVFNRVRPALVYHAAAYKHVPLMETHPDEAFRVNVLGTLNLVQAARTYETDTFVLISTDKAVRPTSTMGATKRIAELIVLAFADEESRTDFVAVRFGNVMGSRGSVVPTFMRQIENGGPVTVMHPGMMRYFISIPEAVSLVIQAGPSVATATSTCWTWAKRSTSSSSPSA
ncbi:MAG: polysaccharide biosynthesis protein [Dehalococcoidia bacterium]|nr:polysaccharide biosynthesis protein [Dehalococcoidia bacterium]